jgi:hypothetical protein
MAGEDDEVIINLQGDTTNGEVVVVEDAGKKAGGTAVSFNDDDGDPLADLKTQFTQMTGRLQNVVADTQQQLAETQQRLQRTEAKVVTNEIDTIEGGIQQLDADADAAQAAYQQAFEAGDGAAMARAQRAMSRAEVQRNELVQARDAMKRDSQRKPAGDQQQRQQPRQTQQDPVEAVASTLSPKSAAWIRSHPQCITDPKMNARMMAAHNLALADDIAVDSDEYFQRIEQGIKQSVTKSDQKQAGDGRRPSSAATSGTGAGGGMNGGTVQVKLTAGEARSATDGTLIWNYDDPSPQKRFKKGDPIGLAEMARRKHEGIKLGLYDRNNIEA